MDFQSFNREKHFTIGGDDPLKEYKASMGKKSSARKWGQMKLFLSGLQFFTLYWNPEEVKNPVAVYIGAMEGTNIELLSKMFPQITFHLYDKPTGIRDFDPVLRKNPKVIIHEQYFDDEEAKKYAGRNDIFLISDIRTTNYASEQKISKEQERINEGIIEDDMAAQERWYNIIKPVKAHLKFRLPYGYDFNKSKSLTKTYLDGLVYLQPWTGPASSEGRLVPNGDKRDWDYLAYESMMAYYNTETRLRPFYNPFTGDKTPISLKLGLGNDFDSVLSVAIINEYLYRFGETPRLEVVEALFGKIITVLGKGKRSLTSS